MKENTWKKPSISVNKNRTLVTLNDSPYPYQIELRRIPTRAALEVWRWQIGDKNWSSPELISGFYRTVCRLKGWSV